MTGVADVLRALADLAPGDTTPDHLLDVTAKGDQPFAWLGDHVDPDALFSQTRPRKAALPWRFQEPALRRLHAYDALHREERVLRAGWLFLCGPARIGGTVRRLCTPLLQRPARIEVQLGQVLIDPLGDPELMLSADARTSAIDLPYLGYRPPRQPEPQPALLELIGGAQPEQPVPRMAAPELATDRRTVEWVKQVVAAAGVQPVQHIVDAVGDLQSARDGDELIVVVGTGLFIAQAPKTTANRGALLEWATADDIDQTAFAHTWGVAPTSSSSTRTDVEIPTPLPLTEAQRTVVRCSRSEAVTVVSGAPGNGKSHVVCAVAIDAVAEGRSVLVATPTPYAADVLGELLTRQPGPQPVLFGEGAGRRPMVAALEAQAEQTVGHEELERRWATVHAAAEARVAAEGTVETALERELRSARAGRWGARLPDLRAAVPGAFAPGADLAEVRARVVAAQARPTWWRKRRLRKLVGSAPIVGVDAIADALEAAHDIRAELELDIIGGTAIGPAWEALHAAEQAERMAEGALVDGLARIEDRWRGKGRRAVAALLRALPAGRAVRRDRLADIDAGALVRALPLWVGTLRDVEDLLPARAGLFDLVIIDEAVQVDQFRAAGALLRARRAVIVGDPRQLRHVSFVADADVRAALERHGVGDLADRLDVRRQSIYDVAAGAAPVTFLDEHFRSVPHLIAFSAKRFYDDRICVATRNPRNETVDAIDVLRVAAVTAEVGAAVDLVAQLVADGRSSIGVLSPFRAQVDAIEAAILDRFEPEVIERHGLRTGTAHSAQGSERDIVVIALGLALGDDRSRWRFVEDPNLFNVLVTRGRQQVTVVTALPEHGLPRGIVADYLRHAERPPAPLGESASPDPWITALAAELERNEVDARVGYPVGRWDVDICTGAGEAAVALDCTVHPEGPAAHIARHRSLRRAGWTIVDAYRSRWDGNAVAAAVELRSELG